MVFWIVGCGSTGNSDVSLNRGNVSKAFSASNISLAHMGVMDGVDFYVDKSFVETSSPKGPWIEIEIFPKLESAKLVQRTGGNITGDDGRLVHPLAIVRNVVITTFDNATTPQRAKARNAVRLLRLQH